jgi:hypothetical protein
VAVRHSSGRFIVGVFLLFLLLTKCPRELLRLICCGFFHDFCDSAFGNTSYFDRTTQQSNRGVNTVVFVVDALLGCIELFARATASVRHAGVDRDNGKSNSNLFIFFILPHRLIHPYPCVIPLVELQQYDLRVVRGGQFVIFIQIY